MFCDMGAVSNNSSLFIQIFKKALITLKLIGPANKSHITRGGKANNSQARRLSSSRKPAALVHHRPSCWRLEKAHTQLFLSIVQVDSPPVLPRPPTPIWPPRGRDKIRGSTFTTHPPLFTFHGTIALRPSQLIRRQFTRIGLQPKKKSWSIN